MWIQRDFLTNFNYKTCLEAIFLKGPRQVGKTSILERLRPGLNSALYFDDFGLRERVSKDPEFVVSTLQYPALLDEVHLAPEIFYSIKKKIDESRRARLANQGGLAPASFRLTGSNLTQINTSVQETLAGRVNTFFLHGLSWNEIQNFSEEIKINQFFFRGGFPELWVRQELNPIEYVNHYITNFIERDLARSIGIEKKIEFITLLRLCAARVGELVNFESLGKDAGVKGKTVKEWLSLLEENNIIYLLRPYSSNLNQRLIKMPKLYFLDMGICTRLQGHQSSEAILFTPQAGHLFENMVISEIVKLKDNFRKDWSMHLWRTKDKEEVDLVIESQDRLVLIEVKLGASGGQTLVVPKALEKLGKKIEAIVVTAAGEVHSISETTKCVPINQLTPYLLGLDF